MSPADFMKRHYHCLFAAIAAILVLARYIPAVYLSALDSDNTQIPLLFHDVVELGHRAHDWVWGGHSDIFPDVTLVFLFEFILRKGLLSLQLTSGIFLAAYTCVLAFLYRRNGGRNPAVFGASVLLFFVLLLVNFGLHDGMEFISISSFVVPMHTSIAILALVCFAICQHVAVNGPGKALWALPVLCFITTLSNDLFLVIFMGPMLAALVVTWVFYPDRLRLLPLLLAAVLIPCVAGHFLARPLSPFQIDPGPFTHFHSAPAAAAWREFVKLTIHPGKESFAIFAGLDVLFVVGVTAFLLLQFFKPAERRIPPGLFMLLSFSAWVIASNWGAVILTGNFTGVLASRYTRFAMLLPVFFALGWINHLIPWSKGGGRAAVAGLSLAISACALFLVPAPGPYYRATQELIPIIRAEMDKEHIQAGLADYWHANMIAFLSHETLPVRAVNNDGTMFRWVNPLGWYAGEPPGAPPEFRMIVMANLNPDAVRRHYGEPGEIIHTPAGKDIWIYPPDRSITYAPVFWTLSNGPANEYRADGSSLPSLTGTRNGNSRVARAGHDPATYLTFGPYPYLHPAPGRYRIAISYTYLSPPSPGKEADYDIVYSAGRASRTLDHGPLPCLDRAPHEISREIAIPDDKREVLEVRTKFNGSGDISIDSLKIVRLGD